MSSIWQRSFGGDDPGSIWGCCKNLESGEKRNVKENDLVLLVEDSMPRGLWPLGVVVSVKRSQDGLVRTVDVRTKSTRLTRPISKIVFLEGDL